MKRFLLFALGLLASCSDPEVSQIIVRIEADPNVAAMTRSIEVQIDGGATRGAFTNAEVVTLDGGEFPREIALAPKNDDPSRFYRVVARARRESIDDPLAETFAQAALVGTYIRGETRVVVLRLEDSCIDIPCGANEHCTGARCVMPPDATPLTDGAVPMDMSVPGDMGTGRCARDADCDDGIDCTIDACTSGSCTNVPDDSRCAAPANACARAVCRTDVGCSDEPRAGPCDDGEFCTSSDSCVGGVCTGGDPPCAGMTTCNEGLDACTGCTDTSECINNRQCVGGTCTCTTGTMERCDMPGDEDCDGLANCADFDCNGVSCGPNGRVCTEGVCDCPGSIELCANGGDDDCDGLTDCDDPDCDGRTCASGFICDMGCVRDLFEICGNGMDDDTDGLADCDDPDCSAVCMDAGIGPADAGIDGGPNDAGMDGGPDDAGIDGGPPPDGGGPPPRDAGPTPMLDGMVAE